MTEHKFTDEQIIEGLNAYVSRMCDKCNVKDLGTCCDSCFITIISQGADLINRQKAQIAEYQKHIDNDIIYVKRVKAEAINEFAERLKEGLLIHEGDFAIIEPADIDNLVKEMTEGGE